MSNIISLLERIGQDATLRHATPEQLAPVLGGLDPALREAVLRGDAQAIALLTGARTSVTCVLAPVDPRKDEDEDAPADDDEVRAA